MKDIILLQDYSWIPSFLPSHRVLLSAQSFYNHSINKPFNFNKYFFYISIKNGFECEMQCIICFP